MSMERLEQKRHLNLFFSKIPEPWETTLLKEYEETFTDSLGKRITFLQEKLSEWCHLAYLLRKSKKIRKENILYCKGNELIIVIGDLDHSYKWKRSNKIKYYNKKRFYPKRRKFLRRKVRFYRNKPRKNSIYRRNSSPHKKIKDCICYLCNELGQ